MKTPKERFSVAEYREGLSLLSAAGKIEYLARYFDAIKAVVKAEQDLDIADGALMGVLASLLEKQKKKPV